MPYIFASFVLPQSSIPKIPVPVPRSKTLEFIGSSFAKSESKTASIPKQKPSLFCIIFKLFNYKSSILSLSFKNISIHFPFYKIIHILYNKCLKNAM